MISIRRHETPCRVTQCYAPLGLASYRIASSLSEFPGLPPLRLAVPRNAGYRRASIGDDRHRIGPIPSFPSLRIAAPRLAMCRSATLGIVSPRIEPTPNSSGSCEPLRLAAHRDARHRRVPDRTASDLFRIPRLRRALLCRVPPCFARRRSAVPREEAYRIEPIPSFFALRYAALRVAGWRSATSCAASHRAYPEFLAVACRRVRHRADVYRVAPNRTASSLSRVSPADRAEPPCLAAYGGAVPRRGPHRIVIILENRR